MKNVVLITIDALRRDHCSCYGYSVPTTPFLSELADKGVKCNRVFSTGPMTPLSFPSIMCGIYSMEGDSTGSGMALPAREKTLAERFKALGYKTGGFQAGNPFLIRKNQYHRGFDTFNSHLPVKKTKKVLNEYEDLLMRIIQEEKEKPSFDPSLDTEQAVTDKLNQDSRKDSGNCKKKKKLQDKFVKNGANLLRSHPVLYSWVKSQYLQSSRCEQFFKKYLRWRKGIYFGYTRGSHLNRSVSTWLSLINKDSPCFLWAHYMDTHVPFLIYPDDPLIPGAPRISARKMIWHSVSFQNNNLDRKNERVWLYDHTIRAVDAHIRDLFAICREHGLTEENTVFVITADHGEEFGDHGKFGHGSDRFYNELLHVPFLCFGADLERFAPYADTQFSLKKLPDILTGTAEEEKVDPEESYVYALHKSAGDNPVIRAAVQDGRYKLIFKSDAPDDGELYDLIVDPSEKQNLSGNPDFSQVKSFLKAQIQEKITGIEKKKALRERLKSTRKRIEALHE